MPGTVLTLLTAVTSLTMEIRSALLRLFAPPPQLHRNHASKVGGCGNRPTKRQGMGEADEKDN